MATSIAAERPVRVGARAGSVREVAWLAYPIVLGQMSQTGMMLVDSIFVGRLGAAQLGALGFAGIWVWTVVCLFSGAASGVQTFVSQAHGAGDPRRCGRWAWQGIYALVPAAAVTITAFVLVAPLLLRWLAPTPAIVAPTLAYLHMRPPGVAGLVVWMVLAAFFRGIGDTRTPLVATVVANAANAVLAYGLVLGGFGLPRLGIAGGGLATSVAEWIGALVLLAALARRRVVRVHATLPVAPRSAEIRRFLYTGAPIGGQWVLDMSSFALFTTLVARMGTASIAANQAMISLLSLSFMQAIGIGLAATTLVGRYKGAGELAAAARSHRSARKLALTLAVAMATLFVTIPETLTRLYTSDPAVLALARPLLALGAVFQLFDALQIVASCALRGAGDTRWPFLVSTTAAWTLRLPLAWLFAVTLGGGVVGAWYAEFTYVLSLAALFSWRFRSGAWRSVVI
jgi:MATE family multidrug resistance protein